MIADKIKLYLLFQISKYFFLILFIFLSVAWILQITRLFTITNFIHIEVLDIFFLSLFLIPNIVTIILPFILIFGLLLCFIKLKKDNELIAILSLGFGLNPFINTLFIFGSIILLIFSFLNFYFSPQIYKIYKTKEYELRNTMDFNKMIFSNFLSLNKTTVLDFNKKQNEYRDIFINFKDEKDNIIYAKKGNIFSKNNKYNFQLTDGFKVSIDKDNQIERLEFLNYILKIDNKDINIKKIADKNTYTIIDDYKSSNYLNISFKILDLVIIIFIIYFFYINNLKNINFNTINNVHFAMSSIFVLILNQILKNSEINLVNYIGLISSIIFISLLITIIKKRYEQN